MRMMTSNWPAYRGNSGFFEEMDRIFENFATNPNPHQAERTFKPACEVTETAEHILLSMDIPGFKKEGLNIEVTGRLLTVTGERKREDKVQSTFTRGFTLPETVDATKIEAHHEDGVLGIYLPKAALAKTLKIEVQNQKGGLFGTMTATNPKRTEDN